LGIFSPNPFGLGGGGAKWQTQFVPNPFSTGNGGDSPVWIQCTTKYVAGDGQSDFGIMEIDFLDDEGRFQRQTFAGPDSSYGSLIDVAFIPRLLGVTVAASTYDAAIKGTLTLFLWG